MTTCAFTGHRPARFSFGYNERDARCVALKQELRQEIERLAEQGVRRFYTGMAQGVDIWAAEIVLELRDKDEKIELIAVRPYEQQAAHWPAAQQARYYTILSEADQTVIISQNYTQSCFFERNRYMVDRAKFLIAVYDGGQKGGTAYTVRYAKQKGMETVIIHPDATQRFV